jgi:hypothetical protein
MHGEPLTREEVTSVINGRARARRVPMLIHFWTNPDAFGERKETVKDLLRRYPQDMQVVPFFMPSQYRGEHATAPGYSWCPYPNPDAGRQGAIDEAVAVADWSRMDEWLEQFPRPDRADLLRHAPAPDGRYRLAHWFYGHLLAARRGTVHDHGRQRNHGRLPAREPGGVSGRDFQLWENGRVTLKRGARRP